MNGFVAATLGWALQQLILSAFLFGLYRLLKLMNPHAGNRFLFLKLAFCSTLFVPFIPGVWNLLPADSVATASGTFISQSILQMPALAATPNPWWEAIPSWVVLLYITVAAVYFLRIVVAMVRISQLAQEHEVSFYYHGIAVRVADLEMPPATFGIFKPTIIVPKKIYAQLQAEELELVLQHEAFHIARRDYGFNLFMAMVKAALFFSPFIHRLSAAFLEEMELSCDALVLGKKPQAARDYGSLLLKLSGFQASPRKGLIYSGLYVSHSFITRRIAAMKHPRQGSRLAITLCTFAFFAMGIAPAVVSLGVENAVEQSIGRRSVSDQAGAYYFAIKGQKGNGEPFDYYGTTKAVGSEALHLKFELLDIQMRAFGEESGNIRISILIKNPRDQSVILRSTVRIGQDARVALASTQNAGPEDARQFTLTLVPESSAELRSVQKYSKEAQGKVSLSLGEPTELMEIVRLMANFSGKRVIVGRGISVDEKVSIESSQAMSEADAYQALAAGLDPIGLKVLEKGDTLKIVRK